jgi:hypothetical protein
MTPMDEIPTPDLAVPYAAPTLANTRAEVTPIKPKKGAEAGQVSIAVDMIVIYISTGGEREKKRSEK